MGRPLIVLVSVAIALPIAGAIAPASGLTSRGVSTPLGSEINASRHVHHVHVTAPDTTLAATPKQPPATTTRRVTVRPPAEPPQTHPATRNQAQPQHHAKKKPKKPKKPVKKHPKPTPAKGGPSPSPKKKPSH